MIRFETVNELALKVTCQGGGVLYTKAGAFIAGESAGGKNYTFEKVLFGPQQGLLQAAFGALTRRMAGENLPLMKVNFGGDSQTYYANAGQHVTAYQLARGEVLSVEAENILAFTGDCDYSVRFLGMGVVSQKGIATSTLTGRGDSAYVAVLSDGNPLVMNNRKSRATISVDPGCGYLLDGAGGRQLRPADSHGHQLENAHRAGIRRILRLRVGRQPARDGDCAAIGKKGRNQAGG